MGVSGEHNCIARSQLCCGRQLGQFLFLGEFRLPELAGRLKLPYGVVEKALDRLRQKRLVDVSKADQLVKLTYHYRVTDDGKRLGGGAPGCVPLCGAGPGSA